MQSFLLQINDVFSLIAIIVSIGTAIGVIISLYFQRRQLEQTKDDQYIEIVRKTMSDLYELYRTENNLKTKNECELFAVRLLDMLGVLAHLNNNGKISKDILEFIEFDLRIAKGVMDWFDEKNLGEKYNSNSKGIWSHLDKYFQNNPKIESFKLELHLPRLNKFNEM